ncbi:hypothetical protein [Allomuricauda sp. d1]|uniref:hypothetical protein n=1 Tax=Allomuricauda sp. d1 TaxID=3136725 RepID=UPI0031D65C89
MKTAAYIILALGFSLTGCSSQKKLVENPPFEVGNATCQSWLGGRAESGSGMKLEIPVTNIPATATLQKAYFRGKVATITLEEKEGQSYATANFSNKSIEKPDIIMHRDPKKEVGNQPPKLQEEIPFELDANECVVSYIEGDTVKYVKVSDIKEKKPLVYQ